MLVTTSQQFEIDVLNSLKNADTIVVDLETTGLQPYLGDRLCGVALYTPHDEKSYYISFRHGEGANLPLSYLELLKPYLTNSEVIYYGWNVKFDVHFLLVDKFPILENRAIYRDVMLALHTLDENRYDLADKRKLNYKLKDNGRLFLGNAEGEEQDQLDLELKKRNLGKGEMWKLPASLVGAYAEQDVILTWKLWQFFLPYLEKWDQVEYFERIAKVNGLVLSRMEHHGIPVNRDVINQHIIENKIETNRALAALKEKYGADFNPNSPVQVSKMLGTSNSKRTTLERLGTVAADDIITYKNLSKAEGTFYKPYLHYSAFDNRIHASFNLGRTTSRRLSSSEPNLQQVPRYTKRYRVKEVFTALPGYKLVEADYNQQELRLGCHFSGQENMTEEYLKASPDVHSLTASHIFTVEQGNVTEDQRQVAKSANFGFSYGMGIMKAAVYIASNLKKALLVDEKFYLTHKGYLPKVDAVAKTVMVDNITTYVDEDGNQVSDHIYQRPLKWEEFKTSMLKMYAGVQIVDDAKEDERVLPDDTISIYTTTKLLFDWKALYSRFTDSLKECSDLANQFRNPDGSSSSPEQGFKFYRLSDGCVRHYIRGQRPFTAWNFLIQGTGASIIRTALLRIDEAYPYPNDEVIMIATVHDSIVFLIKDNENFDANLLSNPPPLASRSRRYCLPSI